VKAVNGVSLDLFQGETLGVVGESGCGKSTLGRTIIGLETPHSGSIEYLGKDLSEMTSEEKRVFTREVQMIFQDPYSSLNPRMRIGEAILEPMEVFSLHQNKKTRKEKTIELLEKVGLQADQYNRYPHEFSGGQRQRICIARTLALEPKVVICDESVSALDVSVQAQVLNLLNELKEEFELSYLFISHDLSVVRYMSDKVLVMNKGLIVEYEEADQLYAEPQDEYTKMLISSAYTLESDSLKS
jgi:peptide/nickel transport system ATP-binding protein